MAIFCSKIYQSSNRKEKIKAEFENPINAELVKQINEYVGDEYKQQNHAVEEDFESHNSDSETKNMSDTSNSNPNITSDSESSKLSEKYGDELDKGGELVSNIVQISESEESDTSDHSIGSAIKTDKTHIHADTVVNNPLAETYVTLSGISNEVKGALNSKIDTQGVVRIAVKNNEMWIYYNDDINLNNVMSLVIELLNAMNYHYLIFNRLARTDNAIVFTINGNDTLNNMGATNNEI